MVSPKHKRLGELAQDSFLEITPKSFRLSHTDSPFKFLQIMDKRFEKLTDQLHDTVKNIFQECKERILAEIDKRLQDTRNELDELSSKVRILETSINEIKSTTALEINNLKKETETLKKEISAIKKCVKKHENSAVACDMRIVGVPKRQGEDLREVHSKICQSINVCPPEVAEIFRIPGMKKAPTE